MKDKRIEGRIQHSLNAELSGLRTTSYQRDRFFENATGGYKVKRKISIAFVLAAALLLITVTALAVALLTPKEVVEQVAVPIAQENAHENYSHDELLALVAALNENGITLDEGSKMMQAFRAGHGYWERETIEEICYAAFGRDRSKWTLEQRHWHGEMMTAIGEWDINTQLLPEEGELSLSDAQSLAAQMLREAYGVALPTESNGDWQIVAVFELAWDEATDQFPREKAQWTVWYYHRGTDNADYTVAFNRHGQDPECTRARYLEAIDTTDVSAAMNDLADREGSTNQWGIETWAELGELIRDLTPTGRNAWLYRHAGYCLPPEGAISVERAYEIARQTTGASGWVGENIICCTDHDRPIYKIRQSIFYDGVQKGGQYDIVWCLELDCLTGEVLRQREYAYGPDSDFMMMYVPFSLLDEAPEFGETAREQDAAPEAEKYEKAVTQYGALTCFWPLSVQADVLDEPHAVPSQTEYDRALEIAVEAVAGRSGANALSELGAYQTGVHHQRFDDMAENGRMQLNWDFMFTTDPKFLSDGYRVQFVQLIYRDGREEIRDLIVEHANLENG